MLKTVVYFIFVVCFSLPLQAEILYGRVIGVTDGDTVKLLDATNTMHIIRLAGIDAPEKKQSFGNASKKSLSNIVYDRLVSIEYYKFDRYSRKVGKILISGNDVNLEQVRLGMAWHYKKYKSEQSVDDFLKYMHAQEEARNNRLGLWVNEGAIAPWEFRKLK